MSYTPPPDQAVNNLPVWRSVAFAYGSLFGNLRHLPAAVVGPLLLSLALGLFFLNQSLGSLQNPEPGDQFFSFALGLTAYIPFIIFCVAWYRLLLIGPEKAAPGFVPTWRGRHWKILGYTLALMLIFIAATALLVSVIVMVVAALVGLDTAALEPGSPVSGFLVLAVFAGIIVIYGFSLRFSFIFPALSVDEDYGMGHAWRHSKGQGIRLLAASLLTSLPLLPFALLVNYLVATSTDFGQIEDLESAVQTDALRQFFLSMTIVGNLFNYLWLALMVSLVAFAFRTCSGWVPETSGNGHPKGPPTGGTIDRVV